jgi:hypothetical protein
MTDSKFKCNIFLFLSVTVFMARLSIKGVNAINPLVAYYDIHERDRCYSFILSRTPHVTKLSLIYKEFICILMRV